MRTKRKFFKKNIRVTKGFKDNLINYANGRELSETITQIILWYNIEFKLKSFEEIVFTSIKYSSVQQEPLEITGDKDEAISVKLDWKDYEVFESNCRLLGIDASEGIRRVIRQVVMSNQNI